ncbi:MAG: PrsW family intramembrane metalloprotease [Flavobacteriales bacterium]|nr:PrsW family intramembrane metalloprotease [Flavobacteriales bacterium]
MVLLVPLLIILFIAYFLELRAAYLLSVGWKQWTNSPIMRATLVFVLLVALPAIVTDGLGPGPILPESRWSLFFSAILISGTISYTWYRFLTWFDLFERERFLVELLVFLGAAGITFLVPGAYHWLERTFDFRLTGDHWNDWWYAFLAIGLIEEGAKLIPLLFIWLTTEEVNEPFDMVLYASISALGFAFVENINYLYITDLGAVMGRTLYASVAHMTFSSIIGYGIAISLHHQHRWLALRIVIYLFVAAAAHGFYDFWLLSDSRPALVTMSFFLGSVQLWALMKNNLIGLSPFFSRSKDQGSSMFRYRIINGVLFILGLAYLAVFLQKGIGAAEELLYELALPTAWVLLAIAFELSGHKLAQGRIRPLRISWDLRRWLAPSLPGPDLEGSTATLEVFPGTLWHPRTRMATEVFPLDGRIGGKQIWKGAVWHLFHPAPSDKVLWSKVLLRPLAGMDGFGPGGMMVVRCAFWEQGSNSDTSPLAKGPDVQHMLVRAIDDPVPDRSSNGFVP